MKRANLVFTVTAWTLAVATIVLNDTVGPLVQSRVNIRWSEAASSGQQRQVEQDLGLAVGERVDGRTWSYVLQNQSPQIIARIVRHPLVDDTHHIDRVKYTIELDVSGHPRWVQRLAELPQIARFAHRLPVVALLFVLVGLLGLWPARDVVFGACRSAVPAVRVRRTGALAPERGTGYALALIALVSLLLRIVLVSSGGQFYWPDEVRYEQARLAAGILAEGEIGEALRRLSYGDHPLFRVLGLVPAAVELAVGENPKVPGVFFAVFSALNIGLLGLIAIRLGATQAEAVAAAGLLALSNAFFYYARHLLPYDSAMTFGLLALYVGVRPDAGLRSSFTCGAFAGCAFLTYTGYWTLAGTALLLHVIDGGYRSGALSKAVFGTFGITAAVGVVIGADAFSGGSLLSDLIAFSGNVNQGRFEEGWRLPW